MSDERKTLSVRGVPAVCEAYEDALASQFAFLAPFAFHGHTAMAERPALPEPRGAAAHCRLAVEAMVRWLYDHDAALRWPYQDTLAALIAEPSFHGLTGSMIRTKIDLIRKTG